MSRYIEKQKAGQVTVTDVHGVRVFTESGEELAAFDGDAAFYFRIARETINLAFVRQAQEAREK